MTLFTTGIYILLISGLCALIAHKRPGAATFFGVGGGLLSYLLMIIPTLGVIGGGKTLAQADVWQLPMGLASFSLEIDQLSAFFLLPIIFVCALATMFGGEYMYAYREKKSLGPPWFFFNTLAACMILVIVARNAILFLFAWEIMSLASFFLVTFEDEQASSRKAGWTYLVASQLGTAFLFFMFILLGANGLDFDKFSVTGYSSTMISLIFLMAIVGFGTKAGFIPFHVWLPEAHPAAPSHVSAVMSGVMIKTGIYGLVRTIMFLGPPPEWWGWLLVAIGLSSGILGVLFALAQHDLKRLLAYHSVENIGIIALGLGVGLLGMSWRSTPLIVLGFGGGLLHVINHACFKGLLFLGAGAVLHETGTREMDHLGGLLKKMPVTAVTFLIGAAAISGLPPLNGFVSEFLIYFGAFKGGLEFGAPAIVPLLGVIGGLALIGGLAAACFTKAFGVVFLGEPRSEHARHAHDPGLAMRIPMIALAASCVGIALFSPFVYRLLGPVIQSVCNLPADKINANLTEASLSLTFIVIVSVGLVALIVSLAYLRRKLLANREIGSTGTWDCGYAKPEAHMQYTSSSFAQPLVDLFQWILRTRRHQKLPQGLFPQEASFASETPDTFNEGLYRPMYRGLSHILSHLRWLQHGRVQLYVLYILATLLILFIVTFLFWV